LDLPGFGKEVNWSFFGEKNLTKDSYLTKCLVQLANIAEVFFVRRHLGMRGTKQSLG
jgi:hypothetical protein